MDYSDFVLSVLATVGRTVAFFAVAMSCAVLLAVWQFRGDGLESRFSKALSSLRFLPAVAWLPLLTLFFVSSEYGRLLFIVIGVVPHLFTRVLESFSSCPIERIFIVNHSQEINWRVMRFIVLPHSLSDFLSAMRFGIGLTFILELVYEFVVPPTPSLGQLVSPLDSPSALAATGLVVTVMLMGLALERTVEAAKEAINRAQGRRTTASTES